MPRIKLLKSGEPCEASIHKTVMEWVRLQPLIAKLIIHVPNEGRRSKRYGHHLKALGLRPGVSDLFITMGKHHYFGAWIELKSTVGVLSPEQRDFLADMRQQNYFTAVCDTIEETISTINWYCFAP